MGQPGAETRSRGERSRVGEYLSTWLPTAVYIVLILIMAARPSPKLPPIRHIDKYLHAFAYGILAVLSYRSFVRTGARRAAVFTFLLGVAVGMSDEGIQALSRMRTADRYDLAADAIGTIIGTLVIALSGRLGRKPASPGSPRDAE